MIIKILNIKNVGKFSSSSMGKGNEYNFAPNTFLFGNNAKGKSTITAILKSLSTGNPKYIVGRKTFGSTEDSEVNIQILNENNSPIVHSYATNAWGARYENIAIFDSRYVAQNVYVDELITEENKKAIELIVLGEQGKKLERVFIDADEECQKNFNRKSEITREFNRHLGHYEIQLEDFRKIIVDKEEEEDLRLKDNEVKAYGAHQQVKLKLSEVISIIKNWDLENFEEKLSLTISLEQRKIKEHIVDHFKTHRGSASFLAQGLEFLKDKNSKERNCVFCGQTLNVEAEKLISEYETLFSTSYRTLSGSVKEALKIPRAESPWVFYPFFML